ncbi:MAG: chemotaxis-specific protein-glutamate methyltransferase CheB [Candidatus Omnitrophota bacterium]
MIKVLIVDDSFVMRKLLSDILNSDSRIEVVSAVKSGDEAIKKIPQLKPDVVTLDLVMPGLDGFSTLKRVMAECPTPVVILSAHSKEDADITIKCLEAGAVSFVLKPSGELSLDIDKVKQRLIEEIKIASQVYRSSLIVSRSKKTKYDSRFTIHDSRIVVIGASTGGPQTMAAVLSSLPFDFSPPVIIVQHLPSIEFTQSLATRLKRGCGLNVKVAEDNEIIESKNIYLVPGGYSMVVELSSVVSCQLSENTEYGRRNTNIIMRLSKDMPDALTPSINTTMKSVAEIYKEKAIGIILTGMGNDGTEGMRAIKNSGGKTLVQDESSLIFGMPKEVIDQGCADSVLPAEKIAGKIVELVYSV